MDRKRRVDLRGILAKPDLRRELMVPTIQATQAREGIETTRDQAERAYYVVTEGDRTAFLDIERFKAGKGEPDRRHETFVRAVADGEERVRFDVARRDFSTIEGSPLAYRRVGLVAHVFRDNPALEPGHARTRRGAYTGDDSQYVRYWWEPGARERGGFTWEPFAKGGDYCRFYYDVNLVVHWDPHRRTFARFYGRKGRETERPESLDDFFRPGLTWPRRTQRGFNVRVLPEGCIFSDKGPSIFPTDAADAGYLLAIGNAAFAEYILQGLTSFGSWETAAVKKLPVPKCSRQSSSTLGARAKSIHEAKAAWDDGNEASTRFRAPWLLGERVGDTAMTIPARLDHLAEHEAAEETRIQKLYAELNDEVYKLYGIPDSTRATIEETLGERPPEVLWPQMEGKTTEQKRMEHVFRLLSYAVKRVVEADEDGIVPFAPVAGEPSLADRVHREIQNLFPKLDIGQVEVEVANELKKNVKGYRRTGGIAEWLENAFFELHCSLYKSRPILWHIASSQGTSPFAFGALVHYHRFDKNRMAQLRGQYVRDAIETFRREAALADKAGRTDARQDWQSRLEETQELDRRLQWVQEGRHDGPDGGDRDYRILTPWKAPDDRPKGWAPDLDDGVKVNIEPVQKAGVLRVAKVV
ncbi:MAG: hypothetical protein HYV63_15570 [Candidatus Schekmanbacteria bacterium]|nr:hypothetical protein [Candidatus Schekmanbacteria bacterium]